MPEPVENKYVLTPEERSLLNEIASQANAQHQGALRMLCAVHKLEGEWRYDVDPVTREAILTKVVK